MGDKITAYICIQRALNAAKNERRTLYGYQPIRNIQHAIKQTPITPFFAYRINVDELLARIKSNLYGERNLSCFNGRSIYVS